MAPQEPLSEAAAVAKQRARAGRRHGRESLVLRVVAVFDDLPAISCGLVDLSVGGARLKLDTLTPPTENVSAVLSIEALKFRVTGKVVRTFLSSTGAEVAVEFLGLHEEVPRRLLEYKLRSYKKMR